MGLDTIAGLLDYCKAVKVRTILVVLCLAANCKNRLASPAQMSITKLSLAGNNFAGMSLTFLQCTHLPPLENEAESKLGPSD